MQAKSLGQGNRLLESLPEGLRTRVGRSLRPVELDPRATVFGGGRPNEHVHFPTGAVISIVNRLSEGQSVEAAVVGWEGVAGPPLFNHAGSPGLEGLVQVGGAAWAMTQDSFIALLGETDFLHAVARSWEESFAQASQSAACNAFHTAEQRLSRWLLMLADRAESDELHLTQEFLAALLGAQRPTVTLVARILQAAGLIEYRYGRIRLIDRPGLRGTSCECYVPLSRASSGKEYADGT